MKRRIGLNLQPLASPTLTGIGTYALEVTKRLAQNSADVNEIECHVFDFWGHNNAASRIASILDEDASETIRPTIRESRLIPLGVLIRTGKLCPFLTYNRLLHSKADLTVFFNYLLPNRIKGKTIVTVYDMVSERYPETMDKRNAKLLGKYLYKSCQRANEIITISEFSKKEIVECLQIPADRIRVAPCGYDKAKYFPLGSEEDRATLMKRIADRYGINTPYILYLGTLEPRKNVELLLDMFILIKRQFPSLKLVLCGGLGWKYEATLDKVSRLRLDNDVIRTGYVSEEDKRILYVLAEIFFFPSFYEGFGLPPLEAMACGTPVICSCTSSLPEVVGEAGFLCDPRDPQAFAAAAMTVLTDPVRRSEMIVKGYEQAGRFSWDRTAKEYTRAISDVVELTE